jgi:hypothetical protein
VSSIIQLQVLNKIISDRSFDLIIHNGITDEYFDVFPDIFNFIKNHYEVYNHVPDFETVKDRFREFEKLDVRESDEYLLDELHRDHLFTIGAEIGNTYADLLHKDEKEGVEYLINNAPRLTKQLGIKGFDLIKGSEDRLQNYLKDRTIDRNLLIPSGYSEMDDVLYGWFPGEDLIIILGRINEGKSTVMMKMAHAAHKAGKRVGIYNSEMSKYLVGYKYDTLNGGFSNRGLITGNKEELTEYQNYITDLQKNENPLILYTKEKESLNGKLTVAKMNALIEKDNLDFFIADQLSGMEDTSIKKNFRRKDMYSKIIDESMESSIKYKIPIMIGSQANRETVRGKDDEESMPELDNISDADEIGAFASRVISIRNLKAGLKFKIIKNRYGKRGDTFLYYHDFDRGYWKFIPTGASHEKQKQENKNKYKDKSDAF